MFTEIPHSEAQQIVSTYYIKQHLPSVQAWYYFESESVEAVDEAQQHFEAEHETLYIYYFYMHGKDDVNRVLIGIPLPREEQLRLI